MQDLSHQPYDLGIPVGFGDLRGLRLGPKRWSQVFPQRSMCPYRIAREPMQEALQ